MAYRITKSCTGCELCAEICPTGAIEKDGNNKFIILINDCDNCGDCVKVCPVGAIVRKDQL